MTNESRQITLIGDVSNAKSCIFLLKKWLKNEGRSILPHQLLTISKEIGLAFKDVFVRINSSRWGSCSSEKHISLCCKLLFLPYPLMRHVLIHELCHTKFMNHGVKFWALLEKYDPNAKIHSKQLKSAAKELPSWVL